MERKWLTLVALVTGIFMLLIDVTIVNVALPDIGTDLGASFTSLEWVVNAYTLTLASSLLVSGTVADMIGRRRVFTSGLGLFALASLGCGLAETPLALNLLRGIQGVGAGMMFATSLAIVAQTFHGRDRGTAFGIIGAATGAAVAVGPLAGGVLTDAFGWEAIFFVNVPIGAAAIWLSLRSIEESKDPHPAGVDWLGAVLFTGALFCLVFALVDGNTEGWSSPQILGLLVASGVLLLAFVMVELRRENPLFDLRLLRRPAFVGASLVALCMSASLFALFLFLTFYLQGGVLGYSPLEAGIRFLPITGMMLLVGPVAGRLTTKVQTRFLLGAGLAMVSVGILLMGGVEPRDAWTTLLAGFVVAGIGSGLVNPPLASTAIGVVEQRRSGMASGINSTFRQVGIAGGIAGLGAIFQHRVHSLVEQDLAGTAAAPHADQLSAAVTAGQTDAALARLPGDVTPQQLHHLTDVAHQAFVGGMNTICLLAAAVAFVGAVAAILLVRQRDFVSAGGPGGPPAGG